MCTDASDPELCAEVNDEGDESPWPYFVKEDVWKDRVKFRELLKKRRKGISKRMNNGNLKKLSKTWRKLGLKERRRLCHISIPVIHKFAKKEFDVPYQTVLTSVLTQVQHFKITRYPPDGIARDELLFETSLEFYNEEENEVENGGDEDEGGGDEEKLEKKGGEAEGGGFCLKTLALEDENIWQQLIPAARSSLLPRRESKMGKGDRNAKEADEKDGSKLGAGKNKGGGAFTFRSDRRLIRHMIRLLMLENVVESALW
eukprot:CAMPEP_0185261832 /NCGR_PEP_ID=MMETSP1359-20130426/10144_1 /TAXON_ID=552665 /ORGANISM="Bigelowiella longifila, Strain CCMP242" /LENGTH=257 /DNA_ID=CAMNT_0027848589 /DNA_START=96 /DNA_END=866 /DNA_ORIENTATION=+